MELPLSKTLCEKVKRAYQDERFLKNRWVLTLWHYISTNNYTPQGQGIAKLIDLLDYTLYQL